MTIFKFHEVSPEFGNSDITGYFLRVSTLAALTMTETFERNPVYVNSSTVSPNFILLLNCPFIAVLSSSNTIHYPHGGLVASSTSDTDLNIRTFPIFVAT